MVASGGHALGCGDVIAVRPVWCRSSRRGWGTAAGPRVGSDSDPELGTTRIVLSLQQSEGAL